MFTGLIQHLGHVREVQPVDLNDVSAGQQITLTIPQSLSQQLSLGASLAVNGACMTIVSISLESCRFEVSPESLSKTTLGRLKPGDSVNLETPLTLATPLGGHFVTGHVDGTAEIIKITPYGNSWIYRFRVEQSTLLPLIVEKGSIAIDGISLTVNTIIEDVFSVTIIPHTWQHTNLQRLQLGNCVNLETDLLGRYVQRLLSVGRIPSAQEQASLPTGGVGTPGSQTGTVPSGPNTHLGLWFNGAPC